MSGELIARTPDHFISGAEGLSLLEQLQAAQRRLEAIDAFLCENGLLKAEDPDEGDALFLTPGGYWEPRECDDVGDHVDAIKKLMEWSREAGYWDAQPAPTDSEHGQKGKENA